MTLGAWTLSWHTPLWLGLAVLFPAAILALRAFRPSSRALDRLVDRHLLPMLVRNRGAHAQRDLLLAAAFALAGVAAAGPYLAQSSDAQSRRGLDLALVIDISPSMTATDIAPSRLQVAQRIARDALASARTDRYGIVAFSAHAYTVLPLTFDKSLTRDVVDSLDPQLATHKGSSLDDALDRASDLLFNSARGSRVILLLSDGEQQAGRLDVVADKLARARIPVIAVGVGTLHGAPMRDAGGHLIEANGQPAISTLARDKLKTLASITGGAYRDGEGSSELASWLYAQLSAVAHVSPYDVAQPGDQSLAAWPLLACVVLLLWWSRSQANLYAAVVIAALLFPPSDSAAAPWEDAAALDALQRGDWAAATQRYGDRDTYDAALGRGVIAYRRNDFDTARDAFKRAHAISATPEQAARAAYNLGNVYVRLDRLDEAAAAYREALRQQPNYSRAALNLSLVNAEQRPSGGAGKRDDAHVTATPSDSNSDQNPSARSSATRGTSQNESNATASAPANTTEGDRTRWQATDGAAANKPWAPENTRAWLERRFLMIDQKGGPVGEQPPW